MGPNFDALGFSALSEKPTNRFAFGAGCEMLAQWEIRIYTASHEFISRPTDTIADQLFLGTLQKGFRLDRSIITEGRIGVAVTIAVGEVTLANLERTYDELIADQTPQGQPITIWMGAVGMPLKFWRLIFRGYLTDISEINRDTVTFTMRDAGHLLDVPLSPNTYAGTGDVEGTEDLKGKRKPRYFGWLKEVSPPLVIPSALAYQLNDGPIQQVDAVYVRGVALDFDDDYASVALMNAATLGDGEYATCLAEGWIRIKTANDAERGAVTVDFAGDKADGVFVETTADIVRRMFGATTVPAGDLSDASFEALNVAQPAPVGYGVAAGSDETAAAAIGALMRGIGGWCGAKRSGRFEVRRFDAPEGGVPAGHYQRTNTKEDPRVIPMPTDLSPPPWRILCGWGRIWTPGQTDLAGAVSDARRAYLAEAVRLAAAENTSVRDDFPPGHELRADDTFFRDEADAQAEAERLGAVYWTPRALFVVKLTERLFVHELGQVASLLFTRLGLDVESKGRIVRVNEDDKEGVELTLMV